MAMACSMALASSTETDGCVILSTAALDRVFLLVFIIAVGKRLVARVMNSLAESQAFYVMAQVNQVLNITSYVRVYSSETYLVSLLE